MICRGCHGKGWIAIVADFCPYGIMHVICMDCGGCGVVHCCEGDQAQASDIEGSTCQSHPAPEQR